MHSEIQASHNKFAFSDKYATSHLQKMTAIQCLKRFTVTNNW